MKINMGQIPQNTNHVFVDVMDQVSAVMGFHPAYWEHFQKVQTFILKGDGPLPFNYRHYIAIMAAGRHQCSYLISSQKSEYLQLGGDESWLNGLNSIPMKLRNLYDINKILAHRPWKLTTDHIEKLTKGSDSWSMAEVVHAFVILTHFHSLCSFVFSCGVNERSDQQISMLNGHELPQLGISTLMQRMKTLSEQTAEYNPTELAKRFETVITTQSESNPCFKEISEAPPPADISCLIDDTNFTYQDFAKRDNQVDTPTFRVQDYSWDDHGFSLLNRLYNEVGTLLDEKFKIAYYLTYYTMGGRTDVDTSKFRRAIWNYIQCLFGIRHDDYDYGEINQLLERNLKAFIKTLCCYPERNIANEYDAVLHEFEHSEKVHINLMILEARMQAELMYALRTVNRYMTK